MNWDEFRAELRKEYLQPLRELKRELKEWVETDGSLSEIQEDRLMDLLGDLEYVLSNNKAK